MPIAGKGRPPIAVDRPRECVANPNAEERRDKRPIPHVRPDSSASFTIVTFRLRIASSSLPHIALALLVGVLRNVRDAAHCATDCFLGSPHNGLGLVVRSDIGSNLPVVVSRSIAPPFVMVTDTGSLVGKVSPMAWSSLSSRLRFEFSGSSLSGDCGTGVSNAGGWERPRIGAFPGDTSR